MRRVFLSHLLSLERLDYYLELILPVLEILYPHMCTSGHDMQLYTLTKNEISTTFYFVCNTSLRQCPRLHWWITIVLCLMQLSCPCVQ